jgi:hypothetical protein
MKTNIHFWSYFAQLYWECKKIEEEIKMQNFMFSKFFENRTVFEIMWKNIVELRRPQLTICRMRIACWIPKATNTHSQYVIFIFFHYNSGCWTRLIATLYALCSACLCCSLRCVFVFTEDQILPSCRYCTGLAKFAFVKKINLLQLSMYGALGRARAPPHNDGRLSNRRTQDASTTFLETFRFAMESSSEIIRQNGFLVFWDQLRGAGIAQSV